MTARTTRWAVVARGVGLALLGGIVSTGLPVHAQGLGAASSEERLSPTPNELGSRIAVIDVQAVLRNSKAAVSIQTQIDTRRDAYQSAVSEEERALREAEQELVQRRATLDQSSYEQAARSFQERVAEVQRNVQARKRALDEAFARAMNEVRQKMVATVAQVADERGYQVVLFKNQIVIAAKSLDISEEVRARLDVSLPRVDVDLPPLE
ncbi:MAG: OmpH family outer membrane protein [Alphaproteobacteria bacterium]|nr:OmpH family outer membrane protein [Alphaproteobacteria bacterium]